MKIYFVRHGQTDHNKGLVYGQIDIELNNVGLQQAELVGRRLENYHIKRIYTSDLKRTIQTAEAIRNFTSAPVIVDRNLREIDLGQWAGINPETVKTTHKDYYEEWAKHLTDMPYPGGESGKDVVNRVNVLLDEILHSDVDNVVVVTHGGVIRILFSYFLQLGLEKRFSIDVENCSISGIKYDPSTDRFSINRINDTAHLEQII